MTAILFIVAILIGLVLCVRIYIKANKSGNDVSKSHAILSGAMILGMGGMMATYFMFKGNGWSEDNKVQFYQYSAILITIAFVIFGLRLLLSGRKQKSILTQIIGAGWIIGVLFLGYKSYVLGGKLNDGWSPEKRAKVTAKCDPSEQNCECFLQKTMEYFESVEDYNETMSDESKNGDKIDTYYAIIDTACACGSIDEDIEEVDLPF